MLKNTNRNYLVRMKIHRYDEKSSQWNYPLILKKNVRGKFHEDLIQGQLDFDYMKTQSHLQKN